jgi:hypothetical protein
LRVRLNRGHGYRPVTLLPPPDSTD